MGDRTHQEKPWKGDTSMPRSLADLLIQVIFSTKDRRPILDEDLTRISHRLTGQAHERPAITSLRLLAVLNGL